MKTIKRTKIIVETREVLLVRGELLQGRCAKCGERVEIVRLQDAVNADQSDHLQFNDRMRFICLNSLLE